MVTAREQNEQIVSPKNMIVLVVVIAVIGLIAALMAHAPSRTQTETHTQDAGNASGANNSLTTGPVTGAAK